MKVIILDRDGVINQDSDEYVKTADEWQPIGGSLEAIAKLHHKGYRIIIISNQSGLSRGKFNIEALNAMHNKMHSLVSQYGGSIEAVIFCPHGPEDDCECRKPKPGLYQQLARRLRISLNNVYAVGDKLTDIQAALSVGAKPVLVRTGYGRSVIDSNMLPEGIPVYDDLAAFVDHFLQEH